MELMVESLRTSKVSQVKMVYEKPDSYLTRRRYNIDIRAETVAAFVNGATFERILDIGCGDGSMSVQLLTPNNRLVLVDMSSGMLAAARSKIPSEMASNVDIVNDNFMNVKLESRSYDLILCIGVLAHVDSPAALVDKIVSLLAPGATLIMESTDAAHRSNRMVALYHKLVRTVKGQGYAYNLISSAEVVEMLRNRGVKLSVIYRYSLPSLPGMDRFIPQAILRGMVRLMYGTPDRNRNAGLGKECIYLFRDSRPKSASPAPEYASNGKSNSPGGSFR
jgi:2-polyprenyl-3-methyl-5-hydroxy-6-metoxy-1,4-benzoquinol methylase